MNNPFINTSEQGDVRYLTATSSINRVFVKKLPVYGLEDTIEGLYASDIFSAELITGEIKNHASELGIALAGTAENELPFILEEKLDSANKIESDCAKAIIRKFGIRLGLILLALKQGDHENKAQRKDWSDAHWAYWASLENIILVGGFASGKFGPLLIESTKSVFEYANKKPYNIIAFENASQVGMMGCTKLIEEQNGYHIVMDFGQSSIKRSVIKMRHGDIADIIKLPSLPSKYMRWNIEDKDEKQKETIALHRYLLGAIADTHRRAQKIGNVNNKIIISIASYTIGGKLNDKRGGYAKLTSLCPNYADCLSEEVSGAIKRQIKIQLVHDGTAAALYFSDYPKAVCITLGTYFGTGFPDFFKV
ncbi:hypothetical protein AGMMS50284_3470 [Clostridia bacterium]|nr:hypothetical protein AGMMS50284_3470 [Clostridia bacterium]